ncbi:hypothetical protein BH24DEI2_BH24DEI2_13460 [soil metagenome]
MRKSIQLLLLLGIALLPAAWAQDAALPEGVDVVVTLTNVESVAWNDGVVPVTAVGISTDGTTWQTAALTVPESPYAWYHFRMALEHRFKVGLEEVVVSQKSLRVVAAEFKHLQAAESKRPKAVARGRFCPCGRRCGRREPRARSSR